MTAMGGWYHCSMQKIGRGAGRSVVAAAAYRLGERLRDEEVDITHDYRRRAGVQETFTLAPENAPDWALDPEQLWNAANAAEKRKNSALAREVELALPEAVTPEARERIAHAFAAELVERYGVGVSVAIHAPSSEGDQRNFHAHILFTTRSLGADGFGAKTRVLDDRKTGPNEVLYLREFAADLINDALEDAGSAERVDHRSFAERGIELEPSAHVGQAGTAIARRDDALSERDGARRHVRERNADLEETLRELAELDAEIRQAEEDELDGRYGTFDEVPENPFRPLDREQPAEAGLSFEDVHRQTMDVLHQPDPGLQAFLILPARGKDAAFDAVHQQTMQQAAADKRITDAQEAAEPGERFGRIRQWWSNMREHFTEWRGQLHEHFENFRSRWHEPPASEATTEIQPEP